MNKLINLTLIFAVIGLLAACGGGVEGEKAETGKAETAKPTAKGETYTVSAADSKINWVGSKKFIGDKHAGFIPFKEGTLTLADGCITGGNFVWDMNQITVTDLKGDKKGWLESHLKGTGKEEQKDDFFNVAKFPTASFIVTGCEKLEGDAKATHNIKGNLTLKGISKSVAFKANIKADGNTISAEAPQFVIDRTEWGIAYGSSNETTVADDMKNKIISNDMGISISLKASK